MNKYKLNICFYTVLDEIEERIILNDKSSILFFNHGQKVFRKDIGFEPDDGHLFASVNDGSICEIVIEAKSDNDADEIVDLFNSCLALFCGSPTYDLNDLITNIHYRKGETSSEYPTYSYEGGDASYQACKMLKQALSSDELKIAVLKFNVAQDVFYLNPMDLEPFNDTYNYQYLISYQIKMGYSIIVSYSILEELNLHVKASKEKPSSIGGQWNHEIITDLKSRLIIRGLNPNKKIRWLSRSIQQRPFKKEIVNSELCEWSDGEDVRDFEICIFEAILETSYIRSQIAAHSSTGKVTQLCLYDVDNANMLVRSILLDLLF